SDIPAGHTVELKSDSTVGSAELSSGGDFINHGTLVFAPGGDYPVFVFVNGSGCSYCGTLTNAADGTVELDAANPSGSGSSYIYGNVVNEGTITVRQGAVYSISGDLTTLTSLSVSPQSASVRAGDGKQFTATGTFSDGSHRVISTQVIWKSSKTAVA